ncbi:MAG: DUF4389 domain-containing protein [Chloroflexi bacterium]|nr:DUF4389 domain-containing protein [Chloroflexota bacterium]
MAEAAMENPAGGSSYPVQFSVDYPESSSRLKALFRIILIIPIGVILNLVSGIIGALFPAIVLMLLFRKKYPRWWFDVNVELQRFSARVWTYFFLLRDEYPSTNEQQAVHLDFEYPEGDNAVNRWLPLIKWLLALPHWIIISVLSIVYLIVVVISWFAIIITGKHPRGLFDFLIGCSRWAARTTAYAFLLTTDRYPPFRFGP